MIHSTPNGTLPRVKSSIFRIQPVFEFRLARLHVVALAAVAVRQRIQVLRGMKDDRRANASAQTVPQDQNPHHHRQVMAQPMTHANQ